MQRKIPATVSREDPLSDGELGRLPLCQGCTDQRYKRKDGVFGDRVLTSAPNGFSCISLQKSFISLWSARIKGQDCYLLKAQRAHLHKSSLSLLVALGNLSKNPLCGGRRAHTEIKSLDLHVFGPGLISSIIYGPLSTARNKP